MTRNKVRPAQQRLERVHLSRHPHRHQVYHIVVYDAHSHRFSKHTKLRSDMAISYYAQCLSSNLPALGAHLVPDPGVHLHAAVTQLTCECDDLANDEFGDRARVREG